MENEKTQKLTWMDRIKKQIKDDKFLQTELEKHFVFLKINDAELLPTIRLHNLDISAFIAYKVDEQRGRIIKECYRKDWLTGEPYKVKVIFGSVEMLISDMLKEVDGTKREDLISGWIR